MGLANILRVLRRHLLVSSLVIGLTVAAAGAFYVLTPTQYETTASFVLFPGATPTDQLFANHPEFVGRNSENPYLNGGDVSTATAVLIQLMQSDDVRKKLVAAGADRDYVVAIDNSVLSGGQMISVTGTGTSAAAAEHTATVVDSALPTMLQGMQTINGAESPFLITARQTLAPDQAVAKTSGKLRSVVVIVVGGFAVLFGALTVLEALAAARAHRRSPTADADAPAVPAVAPAAVTPGVVTPAPVPPVAAATASTPPATPVRSIPTSVHATPRRPLHAAPVVEPAPAAHGSRRVAPRPLGRTAADTGPVGVTGRRQR